MPCKKVVFCLGILWVCFAAPCFAGVVSSQYMEEHVKNQVENLATKTELNEGLQGKQPVGDYALKADIPTVPSKVSELTNDSGYVKTSELPTVPTKTSQLNNDSGYITNSALSGYAKTTDIPTVPTKVSELTNDSGYVGSSALANKVDVGQVTQTLQGVYTITGAIYVPTPALPTAQ